jgi:hypothetical protein
LLISEPALLLISGSRIAADLGSHIALDLGSRLLAADLGGRITGEAPYLLPLGLYRPTGQRHCGCKSAAHHSPPPPPQKKSGGRLSRGVCKVERAGAPPKTHAILLLLVAPLDPNARFLRCCRVYSCK